ncbi:FHA domain-containing protein [Poseidonocella sp. HB161398]|uniref:FHA domain-containing protein n=1 Tax=Poseidonocella sp. HB161398 TaxID=2320855 RepID=UPI00110860AC|nr:FHA domain-containing protein [Poseidonocella sp. HB161398]
MPPLELSLDCGSGPPRSVRVEHSLTLGHAEENGLVIGAPGGAVSAHHCVIARDQDRYVVIDRSTGGTFVNGTEDLRSRDAPFALRDGDWLQIGPCRLTVTGGAGAAPPPAAAEDPVPEAPADAAAAPAAPDLLDQVLASAEDGVYAVRPEPATGFAAEPDALFPQPAPRLHDDHLDPQRGAYLPPAQGREPIPETWDLMAELRALQDGTLPEMPPPAAEAPPAPPPPDRGAAALAAFAEAAGLDPALFEGPQGRQRMTLAGRLLAASLSGLQMLLADCARRRDGPGSEAGDTPLSAAPPGGALARLLEAPQDGQLPGDAEIARACSGIADQHEAAAAMLEHALDALRRDLAPAALVARLPAPPQGPLGRLRHRDCGCQDTFARLHGEVSADLAALCAELGGRAGGGSRDG